jgi:hypothetical protein
MVDVNKNSRKARKIPACNGPAEISAAKTMDLKTTTTKVSSNEVQSQYLNARNRGIRSKNDFQKI